MFYTEKFSIELLPQDFDSLIDIKKIYPQFLDPFDCPVSRAGKRKWGVKRVGVDSENIDINGDEVWTVDCGFRKDTALDLDKYIIMAQIIADTGRFVLEPGKPFLKYPEFQGRVNPYSEEYLEQIYECIVEKPNEGLVYLDPEEYVKKLTAKFSISALEVEVSMVHKFDAHRANYKTTTFWHLMWDLDCIEKKIMPLSDMLIKW